MVLMLIIYPKNFYIKIIPFETLSVNIHFFLLAVCLLYRCGYAHKCVKNWDQITKHNTSTKQALLSLRQKQLV